MQLPTFRSATVDDAELVRTISANAYIPAYEGVTGTIPLPAQEDYTGRILNGDVWIAEVDGVAAGVLVVEEGDSFLMVYSIAVSPQYQRRGLGIALLAHAESYAAAKSLREIRLYTNKRMVRNVALYEHYGFIRKGERPHPIRMGEMLLDMYKQVEIGKA